MKIVIQSAYRPGEKKSFPMNNREDLAKFLKEFPSATHAAISHGVGNVAIMAKLAAKYLSSDHMDVTAE